MYQHINSKDNNGSKNEAACDSIHQRSIRLSIH